MQNRLRPERYAQVDAMLRGRLMLGMPTSQPSFRELRMRKLLLELQEASQNGDIALIQEKRDQIFNEQKKSGLVPSLAPFAKKVLDRANEIAPLAPKFEAPVPGYSPPRNVY